MATSNQRLIPANTTLLQPGSRYFRISDALNYQQQTSATANASTTSQITSIHSQISAINTQITTLQTTDTSLQNQINTINSTMTDLQSQIDTINSRLAAANIP